MENKLTYETINLGCIHPNPRNARTHSKKQIKQIATSIKSFGFTNPILIDAKNMLIAGHGRLEAAMHLGLDEVPAIRVENLSDAETRALMLADNKIAANAGWDLEILAHELADLSTMDLSFDLDITGFEVGEIDLIVENAANIDQPEAEVSPMPDPVLPLITQTGDLWRLGPHKVLCGDARSGKGMAVLMGDELAHAAFVDPPYNVKIAGHVSGNGKVKHREFTHASGDLSSGDFQDFLTEAFETGAHYSRDGAVWFACMDWRHMAEMLGAGTRAFDTFLNLCVWVKTNGGMGSLYRSQHELVFVFRKGREVHRNNVQLGRFGRNRTNIWTYPGVNTFRPGRMEELSAHPTAKPVAMIRDAILDVTAPGEIVLDSFLGAGATLMAADQCGRIARGMEIDPVYVDVTLRRWRKETGVEPVRANDGACLVDLEATANKEACK